MLILYNAIADIARCRVENSPFFCDFYVFSGRLAFRASDII